MKRLISKLKVLTYVNLKFTSIIILLLSSMIFGYRYLNSVSSETDELLTCIEKSELSIVEKTKLVNRILILDNKMLSKSLDDSTVISDIENDIILMRVYTTDLVGNDSVSRSIEKVVSNKEKIYRNIIEFNSREVDVEKVHSKKSISVVSKNIKKGIFRTKVEYDTVYRVYNEFNEKLYSSEYDKVTRENSIEINELIKMNNRLTLMMKIYIDDYSNIQTMESFKEKEAILLKLMRNIKTYIISTFVLIIFIIFLTYLLVSDIRKIKRTNKRYNDTVSLLMDKIKKK